MKISIILAHPRAGSFNHAIAAKARSVLEESGHAVTLHDLYAEGFDPVLPDAEIPALSEVAPEVEAHCREIAAADGIVIVHPNWWGQPPAILKGWVDRVLRAGVAYRFLEGDSGEGVPEGLLKAENAIVFNTTNTEKERELEVFGDPLETLWKNCILRYCGVSRVERRCYGVVVTSTPEERAAWLEDAASLVREVFPS
ncbi:MAG: NAD(P)H-dependent oxidoreductase [Terracidiphilus sp.]|jgi:putative NADPH-quinone reductase